MIAGLSAAATGAWLSFAFLLWSAGAPLGRALAWPAVLMRWWLRV